VPNASSVHAGQYHVYYKVIFQLTDVDISKRSQALPELLNIGFVCLDLLALGILAAPLLFGVEPQVLEQNDLAILCIVDNLLDFWSDRVWCESDFAT
jgi:hypothetical protein